MLEIQFFAHNFRLGKRYEFSNDFLEFADFEWMIEEGADEKLQREVEEQLKFAELERMMMQEEQEAGDLQVILHFFNLQGDPLSGLKFVLM